MRGASATLVEAMQLDLGEIAPHLSESHERRMLQTVLHDAIEDACNSRRTRKVTLDARAWIFGEPDRTQPRRWELGDFEPLCVALDVDPNAVREYVARVIAGQVTRERRCRLTTVRTGGVAA